MTCGINRNQRLRLIFFSLNQLKLINNKYITLRLKTISCHICRKIGFAIAIAFAFLSFFACSQPPLMEEFNLRNTTHNQHHYMSITLWKNFIVNGRISSCTVGATFVNRKYVQNQIS